MVIKKFSFRLIFHLAFGLLVISFSKNGDNSGNQQTESNDFEISISDRFAYTLEEDCSISVGVDIMWSASLDENGVESDYKVLLEGNI